MKIKNKNLLSILKKDLEASLELALEVVELADFEIETAVDIYAQIRDVISNIEEIEKKIEPSIENYSVALATGQVIGGLSKAGAELVARKRNGRIL